MKWIVANMQTQEVLGTVELSDEETATVANLSVEWDNTVPVELETPNGINDPTFPLGFFNKENWY